jgi:hypothetical protein
MGDKVGVAGKRWNNPDYLSEFVAGGAPDLIKFWRSPVFGHKFHIRRCVPGGSPLGRRRGSEVSWLSP